MNAKPHDQLVRLYNRYAIYWRKKGGSEDYWTIIFDEPDLESAERIVGLIEHGDSQAECCIMPPKDIAQETSYNNRMNIPIDYTIKGAEKFNELIAASNNAYNTMMNQAEVIMHCWEIEDPPSQELVDYVYNIVCMTVPNYPNTVNRPWVEGIVALNKKQQTEN